MIIRQTQNDIHWMNCQEGGRIKWILTGMQKNGPRRKWFFAAVETLLLVCHYAFFVDLSSEMTIFRDQTFPYCAVNTKAPEHTAKTAMLIIRQAARILTQCNSLDGKHVRTNPWSPFLTFTHTMYQGRKRGFTRGERHTVLLWRYKI